MSISASLLERAEALEQLEAALRRSSSEGRVVMVAGEAGIGKTALVRAFCRGRAPKLGAIWGRCDALFTPRPLGPVLEIADQLGGGLASVVEGEAPPHRVVAALQAELAAMAPAVVVFEDLHWADEGTLDVLRLLARRVGRGVLVIGTYRDDELTPEHPLRIVLGELATADTVERLSLPPLTRTAVGELCTAGGVDTDELYRRTGGNPFFVTEVLATPQDGIPDTVRDAVLARAARMDVQARALLEAVAVVRPQIELRLLEAIAGPAFARVDACVSSGMLASAGSAVAFRHELARQTIEESLAPARALALHRAVLGALTDPATGVPDLARLAHHAEAAGDAGAVIRFAPAAGARAAELGAHREAAAQYERALRHARGVDPEVRADLLERRAFECYATGQVQEAIAVQQDAVALRRRLGDPRAEGDALRSLGRLLGFARQAEAGAQSAREAVAILERLEPGHELAMAYATLSQRAVNWDDNAEGLAWGTKALELAESLGDAEATVYALINVGSAQYRADDPQGRANLERARDLAREAGLDEQAGRAMINIATCAMRYRALALLEATVAEGVDFCDERGLDLWRTDLQACGARLELDRAHWDAAAEQAQRVTDDPRVWWVPRLLALNVVGLARARRGGSGAAEALDEAWELASSSGELMWIAVVAAGRAEAAWLRGDAHAMAAATDAALGHARERSATWAISELRCWRRRAGLPDEPQDTGSEPYALELAGDWQRAAAWWRDAGCPYEAALALADSDEPPALRQSLDELQQLGAAPAAAIVSRRLRSLGERGLPRGPRAATRANPAGLTPRELDVLGLVAQGLRNAEIAARLFLSEKTIDHHVSAILRKLDVSSRLQAARAAARLGIVLEHGDQDAGNMGNAPVSPPPV